MRTDSAEGNSVRSRCAVRTPGRGLDGPIPGVAPRHTGVMLDSYRYGRAPISVASTPIAVTSASFERLDRLPRSTR